MIEIDPIAIAQLANDLGGAVLAGGPPTDLPAPVPEFVGDVLETIRSSLDGGADRLGEAVSEVTPDGAESAPADAAGDGPESAPVDGAGGGVESTPAGDAPGRS